MENVMAGKYVIQTIENGLVDLLPCLSLERFIIGIAAVALWRSEVPILVFIVLWNGVVL